MTSTVAIIIQAVWQIIRKLKQEGLSILLVEQNAALALQLVDYVHVMSKGQVVHSADPQALQRDHLKVAIDARVQELRRDGILFQDHHHRVERRGGLRRSDGHSGDQAGSGQPCETQAHINLLSCGGKRSSRRA